MKGFIYRITNLIDGKFYIGSTNNRRNRWSAHRKHLRKGTHDNGYLQNAWNKHGEQQFKFEVLEKFEDCDEEMLSIIEQWYLDNTHCLDRNKGYNLNPISNRPHCWNRGVPRSEESKKKASEKCKAMWSDPIKRLEILAKQKLNKHKQVAKIKGKQLSLQHKEKISESVKVARAEKFWSTSKKTLDC